MPDAYPAYFGSAYEHFDVIRRFTDGLENLFLIGRNGMHRYNNQDHSMLSAMAAAGCIASGTTDKDGIWAINAEAEYHESDQRRTNLIVYGVLPEKRNQADAPGQ